MYSSPSKSPLKASGPVPCRPSLSTPSSPKAIQMKPPKCILSRSPQNSSVTAMGAERSATGLYSVSTSPISRHSLQSAYKQGMNDACAHKRPACDVFKAFGRKNSQFAAPKTVDMMMTKEPSRNLLRSFSSELGTVQEDCMDPYLALCCDSPRTSPTSEEPHAPTSSCRQPPPVELIDAVLTGDALSSILDRLSRKDIGSLRLTCKRWSTAVTQKVTTLVPASMPPKDLGQKFPATTMLDLTLLGAKRFRSIKGSMLSCQSMLTGLELGDNRHGGGSWLCNQDTVTLSSLHKLRTLKIFNPKSLTQQGIENLSRLSELEDLTIDKCKSLSVSLVHMVTLWPKLKTLRLGGCKLHSGSEDKSARKHGHGLSELYLRSCSIQEPGMLEICSLKGLQSLRFEKSILDCSITSPAVLKLSGLNALTELKIINVSVDTHVLCCILKRLPKLKVLKVIFTDKRMREIKELNESLATLKHLEEVDLEGLKMSWTILDSVSSATSVTLTCPQNSAPWPENTSSAQVKTMVLHNVPRHVTLPAAVSSLENIRTVILCLAHANTDARAVCTRIRDGLCHTARVLAYGLDQSKQTWLPISSAK